jgi:hypothetical protein
MRLWLIDKVFASILSSYGIVGGCRDGCVGWLLVGCGIGVDGFRLALLSPWLNWSISIGLVVLLGPFWVRCWLG